MYITFLPEAKNIQFAPMKGKENTYRVEPDIHP